ncbi:MAG: hypothetical protein WCP77_05660 [Roseococcus sp.]
MLDALIQPQLTDAEIERRLLERVVREAEADPTTIPHETVRNEMLRELEHLRRKIAAVT